MQRISDEGTQDDPRPVSERLFTAFVRKLTELEGMAEVAQRLGVVLSNGEPISEQTVRSALFDEPYV